MENKQQNLEDIFNDLFKKGTTGTGEEELLRVAAKYSMQLSAQQIKCLLYIAFEAEKARANKDFMSAAILNNFVIKWLEWKEYNNSAGFIMRVIGDISMRRFLTEQSFKVDIKK